MIEAIQTLKAGTLSDVEAFLASVLASAHKEMEQHGTSSTAILEYSDITCYLSV
ncbi:MAG: hypothetical protein Q8P68_00225 [Candidatus Peregrinibacteria bacterium]|nr:hypothetical protein [Candidatus Peregrinibacteria bacterium]